MDPSPIFGGPLGQCDCVHLATFDDVGQSLQDTRMMQHHIRYLVAII
jgi:hypothetical protein